MKEMIDTAVKSARRTELWNLQTKEWILLNKIEKLLTIAKRILDIEISTLSGIIDFSSESLLLTIKRGIFIKSHQYANAYLLSFF
jgi:hypothetical protein